MTEKKQLCTYNTDHGDISLTPELVRKYLVSGKANSVSDQEIKMFIGLCKYQKLNPFLKEVYFIKLTDKDYDKATIVVGKEVFTKRASKHPFCAGWNAGVIVKVNDELINRDGSLVFDNETLVGAWCDVYRKDWTNPLKVQISLKEYIKLKIDGKPMSTWAKMPATMIRKVAIVQALREAFPEDLQGLYTEDEMGTDIKTIDQPVEPVNLDSFLEEEPTEKAQLIESDFEEVDEEVK